MPHHRLNINLSDHSVHPSISMAKRDGLHVVMFPWLAMGHLAPFLHLSKYLAQNGHRVSFVSTPRNLMRLPNLPPDLAPLINLVSFPLPRVENLADDAESSMDVPHYKSQFLKKAFDLLQSPLTIFLQTTSPTPDWIVHDYASHWVSPVAAGLGVSRAFLSLFSAATLAFIGPPGAPSRSTVEDFTLVPSWIRFESDVVYRLHECIKIFESSADNQSGTSDIDRFYAAIEGSDVVFLRSSVEFEPEWIQLIRELYRKPVVPVGFLPPPCDDEWGGNGIKEWLDKQSSNSVVYVALGSESTVSRSELVGLALGLEKSKLPFFWALREQPESTQSVIGLLPEGFAERVRGRGVVHVGWVPQVNILSHPGVGGFLTHCGWNSIIEGIAFGRVLILFPILNEQGLNARLLQSKKLGVEIPRNELDGSFSSESVAESVRLAMVEEEGQWVRSKAREMRDLFGNKDKHRRHVDSFVSFLEEIRRHPAQ